jgi:YtfJ family uncharacterized protein
MRNLSAIFLLTASLGVQASPIEIGQPLPALEIDSRGELLLSDEKYSYQPWQASRSAGKPHVIQYLAGRVSARDQSKPFTDRLQEAVPEGSVHVTTVINLDDAMWGTSGFVVGEIKDSKRKHPMSTMVLDEDGLGLQTWQLQKGGATIVVLNATGTVLYLKQGGMSEEEIESTLEIIQLELAP